MKEYSQLAVLAIDAWLDNHVEPLDKQEEAEFAEYPKGFYKKEFSYSYTFSVGFNDKLYGYLKMGPIPYDVKVERSDWGTYASEVDRQWPSSHLRVRYIDADSTIV